MLISTNFSRFMFGVVLKEVRNAPVLEFEEFKFKFRPGQIAFASMRELFKHLDLDYPRDSESRPHSYKKLNGADMSRHIEWIVKIAGQSGYELPHITKEWERLLYEAGISK